MEYSIEWNYLEARDFSVELCDRHVAGVAKVLARLGALGTRAAAVERLQHVPVGDAQLAERVGVHSRRSRLRHYFTTKQSKQ